MLRESLTSCHSEPVDGARGVMEEMTVLTALSAQPSNRDP